MDLYENENPLQPQEQTEIPSEECCAEEEQLHPQPKAVIDPEPEVQEAPAPMADTPATAKKEKHRKLWKPVLASLLILVLVAGSCGATAYGLNYYWKQREAKLLQNFNQQFKELQELIKDNSFTGNGNSVSGTPNTNPDGLTPGQVYATCVDTVVAISVTTASSTASSGSGFIISADGYILTNYHVVENSASITVTTHGSDSYSATLIGYDDNHDLALLKADAQGLPVAKIGSSDDLIVGDQVVAIGNPLGELTSTLTVGYISAKGRDVTTEGTIINMLQTDAAINPGNSGGPLFNMKGEVIGITTAKYSGTSSSGATYEGLGFAIPIDDILDKVQQLNDKGYVSTPYMGISVNNSMAGMGALVISVDPGSAAQAAGLRIGDIIVALGSHGVTSVETLTSALQRFQVGDTTIVCVYRNRQILELPITLMEKPRTETPT